MLKTAGLADIIRQALAGVVGIRLAFIYGSAAKGTLDAKSDVDVLVVTDGPVPDVSAALLPAQERLAREVAATVYSTQEFAEKREARDRFLGRVLAEPKIMLAGRCDDAS
jgi:predicted nucleotidyltransferase